MTNFLVRGLREQREFEQGVERLHEMDEVLMPKWRSRNTLGTSAPLPDVARRIVETYVPAPLTNWWA